MADNPEQTTEAAEQPKKKGLPTKLLAIILGIAVVQGVGFFVVFKFFGGSPEAAHGEGNPVLEAVATTQPTVGAEVQLLKGFKVPNDKAGVLRIYDLDLSVVVDTEQKEDIEKLVEERKASIADTVARIVRGATARMLGEDDLRVLRGQLMQGLEDIFQDDTLVQRVLIPKFVPIRAE